MDLAFQVGLNEGIGPSVCDPGRKFRARAGEPDIDQTRQTGRLDIQVVEQDFSGNAHSDIAALRCISSILLLKFQIFRFNAKKRKKFRVVHEAQLTGDTLRQGSGFQKTILGLIEFLVRHTGLALHALEVGHLAGITGNFRSGDDITPTHRDAQILPDDRHRFTIRPRLGSDRQGRKTSGSLRTGWNNVHARQPY